MNIYENTCESNFESVDLMVKDALKTLEHKIESLSKYTLFKINFMLREMLNNAVEHGNHFDVTKKVMCRIVREGHFLKFHIKDEGAGIILCDTDAVTCHNERYLDIKENLKLEKIKSINESITDIKVRNRGFDTVSLMDFSVKINHNSVWVTLDLSKEDQ